jgi:hypothetical protein
MTDEISAMAEFLRARYADGIASARQIGNVFITEADRFGVRRDQAEQRARLSLHAAEIRSRFFEETVASYLGTAGPTGRIAEQQLRLLACEHLGHADFDERWAP